MGFVSKVKNPASSMQSRVLAGTVGALTTMIIQKGITASWKSITGTEPPDPTDPDASTTQTVAWAAASAVGLAVAQALVTRYASKRLGPAANRLFKH